jgi:toxin FitB
MSYLVDTNVLSETFKDKPNSRVVDWYNAVPPDSLFISVLTLGEIRKGIEKLNLGKKKNQLVLWLEHHLPAWFDNRILPITREITDRWGYLCAHCERSLPAIDGLLASTALIHNLKFVTRNVKDFDLTGLELINPFE